MTLRGELEKIFALGHSAPTVEGIEELKTLSVMFLRDHGPALLEALADAERLDWLQNHAHTVYTSHDPSTMEILHFVAVDETLDTRSGNVAKTVRQALDAARRGGG